MTVFLTYTKISSYDATEYHISIANQEHVNSVDATDSAAYRFCDTHL